MLLHLHDLYENVRFCAIKYLFGLKWMHFGWIEVYAVRYKHLVCIYHRSKLCYAPTTPDFGALQPGIRHYASKLRPTAKPAPYAYVTLRLTYSVE